MKKLLHLLQHISFVMFAVLLCVFVFAPEFTFSGVKYSVDMKLSSADAGTEFFESDHFNKMFAASLSDVIEYAGIKNYLNSDEYKEAVSGNSLKAGDDGTGKYNSYYASDKTNFRFFFIEQDGNLRNVYTNLSDEELKTDALKNILTEKIKSSKPSDISDEGLKSIITAYCPYYLYFNPADGGYETNLKIDKDTVYYLFHNSDYSFPDDSVLIAGVKSFEAEDGYSEAYRRYENYAGNYWFIIAGLILSGFIYLALMLILTVKEGVVMDKELKCEVIKNTAADKLPIELRLIVLCVCAIPYFVLFAQGRYKGVLDNVLKSGTEYEYIITVAAFALITSIIISFFYYGLIRRLKGRLIWKTSLVKKLFDKLKAAFGEVYNNSGLVFKAFIPYVIIAVLTLITMIFISRTSMPGNMSRRALIAEIISGLVIIASIAAGFISLRSLKERKNITDVISNIAGGDIKSKVSEDELHGENIGLGRAVNHIGDSVKNAVETSMKDEKMKADLITNVSHDLKTPLTSIINYVDLLKKENIDNENAVSYINILDEKSQRLKQLTNDLVEVSKISSGNIELKPEKINLKELLKQASGEFYERYSERGLSEVLKAPEDEVYINADSRSIYRVIENLYTNICKYALSGTRIYIDIERKAEDVILSIKNISEKPLNVMPEELTERFIRGDEARTSEGSGLGLSIAKSLTEAMGGSFNIVLDGDLFKAELTFKECK